MSCEVRKRGYDNIKLLSTNFDATHYHSLQSEYHYRRHSKLSLFRGAEQQSECVTAQKHRERVFRKEKQDMH